MSADSNDVADQFWYIARHLRNDGIAIGDYVEQLTAPLFLKTYQVSPRLDVEDLPERARWDNLLQASKNKTGEELIDYYEAAIEDLKRDSDTQSVFTHFVNRFTNPVSLKNTIQEIENLTLWKSYSATKAVDLKGAAYEFILEKYADKAEGAGEYFTPRPLIRAMISFVDPKYDERIHDPAAGTGGFIIQSYEHILEETNNLTAAGITREDRRTLDNNLTGIELNPQTRRLGLMNLLLHNININKYAQGNSLKHAYSQHDVQKDFDVILANPPYGSNGGEKFGDKFLAQTSALELNFLQLIMQSLGKDGRAGVVAPEGVLFQTGTAPTTVRKELLKKFDLDTILILPEKSFQPYAGVDANVLFFSRDKEGTEDVTFYDLRTDSETIKDSNPLSDNHFKEFVELNSVADSDRAFTVNIEEIEENDYSLYYRDYLDFTATANYNDSSEILSEIERLHNELKTEISGIQEALPANNVEDLPSGWEVKEIGDFADRLKSTTDPSESPDVDFEYYSFPSYDEDQEPNITAGSEIASRKRQLHGNELLFARLNPRKKRVWRVSESEYEKIASTEFVAMNIDESECMIDYLYYYLNSDTLIQRLVHRVTGATGSRKRIGFDDVMEIEVPLPPITKQKDIIKKFDKIFEHADHMQDLEDRLSTEVELLTQASLHEYTRFDQIDE